MQKSHLILSPTFSRILRNNKAPDGGVGGKKEPLISQRIAGKKFDTITPIGNWFSPKFYRIPDTLASRVDGCALRAGSVNKGSPLTVFLRLKTSSRRSVDWNWAFGDKMRRDIHCWSRQETASVWVSTTKQRGRNFKHPVRLFSFRHIDADDRRICPRTLSWNALKSTEVRGVLSPLISHREIAHAFIESDRWMPFTPAGFNLKLSVVSGENINQSFRELSQELLRLCSLWLKDKCSDVVIAA